MTVEVVAASGLKLDVHHHQVIGAVGRDESPSDHPPVEVFAPDVGQWNERAHRAPRRRAMVTGW
jgi:hypothetical protein